MKCKNQKCVPANKVCDFSNDCGVGDDSDEQNCAACTFETGIIECFADPFHGQKFSRFIFHKDLSYGCRQSSILCFLSMGNSAKIIHYFSQK